MRKIKAIYTPYAVFSTNKPLGWKEIIKNLNRAVEDFNRDQQEKFSEKSFIYQVFHYPQEYKVMENEVVVKDKSIRLIWIVNTKKERLHFDIYRKKDKTEDSLFFYPNEKYEHFKIKAEETSQRWLDKMYSFMIDIMPYIRQEMK